MLLKDGITETDDTRLAFIPNKDERSRLYKAVDAIEDDTPELVYRDWFPNIWLNQQAEGSCVGHSLAQELATSPVRYTEGIDDPFAFELYHEAQHRDPWPGCHKGLQCPVEPSRQAYEGTSLLAGLQILSERGKIKEYRWAFGEEDLALSVGNLGPAVIGVPWYESMYHPHPETNYIAPSGRKVGGHAIVVAGFDPYREHYKLWNSWGKDYGINGWAYLSRSDMTKLLADNGEAAIPLQRKAS